ncbi:cytochrome P450 [Lactarius akahatsu]|uniref:Cytochrome P450 n=1 Tax=Lactarius akahatsu TaxID=416441 RepID=A0AAD4LJ87_9AGAM|nr:cytochrome P450 [Lactarius akahatsu]
MLISPVTAIDCLALSTFLYILCALRDHRRRRGFPYPPGPPPLPAIGNLLDVPKLSPWLGYANMSKKYGDVVCFQVLGQVVVVLCSPTAIKDLLEKRGELMNVDWLFPLSRTGKYWREGRRLLDRSLRPGATALHRHLIEEKTRKIVMRLTYGYDLKENDDMLVPPKRVVEIMTHLSLLMECQREGTAVPSLATEFLPEADLLGGLERQQAVQGIEDILGTYVEHQPVQILHVFSLFPQLTWLRRDFQTVAAMYSLFLALILYPEVQKRAQAEIDSVISRDRLPTYDDRPRLPYIEAMSKELLRWRMVTPMGVPHSPTDDDFYKGYFIPKGAVVIGNGWAVLHDPELYPDPEAFNPGRFLNEDGTFRDDPMISLAFGAGRRICPSRHLVDVILFVVTASVLSVFNVTRAKDENGNEIPVAPPPLESVLPDVTVWVPGFECGITPRDKVAEDLIRASAIA